MQGAITKYGRVDLHSAMVMAARHSRNVNKHWKEVYRRPEPRLGRNRATVAVARQIQVAVWHILTKHQADHYANWAKVATNFMSMAYADFGGAEHIPGGRTAPEFTRWCLDTLGVCQRMQPVKFTGKTYTLRVPQSTLPGAAPEAEPIGRGRRQNTRLAKDARLALAEHKRAQLEAQRVEAETRMERPRNTRSDKGKKRWPRANRRAGPCIVFYL